MDKTPEEVRHDLFRKNQIDFTDKRRFINELTDAFSNLHGRVEPLDADSFFRVLSHWKFNGNLEDSVGPNDLFLQSGSVMYVDGVYGQAVSAPSSGAIIDNPSPDVSQYNKEQMTLEGWLRLNNVFARWPAIPSFQNVTFFGLLPRNVSPGFIYHLNDNGEITIWPGLETTNGKYENSDLSPPVPSEPADIKMGEMIHVALTYDGEKMETFFNGEKTWDYNLTGDIIYYDEILRGPLTSGTRSHEMDHVRLWNKALSPDRISNIYQQGVSNLG